MRQMDKKEAKGKISVEDVLARARKTKGRFQPSVSAKGLWTPGDWMQAKMPDEASSDGSIEDLRNDFGMEPNSGEDSSQQQVSRPPIMYRLERSRGPVHHGRITGASP